MALSKVDPNFLNVSQVGGRRNLIINGAMQVAQRGTSSSSTTGINVCDRWRVNGATFSFNTTQNTLTSSDDPYTDGFRYSLKTENTSAATNITSYQLIRNQIEGQNIAQSGWDYTNPNSYITLSFWVKSSLAGTYYYHVRTDDGTSQMYISSVVLSSNQWKKVELTIPGNSSITVDNDTGSGLNINWYVHLGTNYSDNASPIETWTAYNGGGQTPDYTQDWGNTSGATFEITGVQLEVGDTATPFEHRSYAEEYQACLRYFYRFNDISEFGAIGTAIGTTSAWYVPYSLPVHMRTDPSISVSSASHFRTTLQHSNTTIATSVNIGYSGPKELMLSVQAESNSAGTLRMFGFASTSGYMDFSAEF